MMQGSVLEERPLPQTDLQLGDHELFEADQLSANGETCALLSYQSV